MHFAVVIYTSCTSIFLTFPQEYSNNRKGIFRFFLLHFIHFYFISYPFFARFTYNADTITNLKLLPNFYFILIMFKLFYANFSNLSFFLYSIRFFIIFFYIGFPTQIQFMAFFVFFLLLLAWNNFWLSSRTFIHIFKIHFCFENVSLEQYPAHIIILVLLFLS